MRSLLATIALIGSLAWSAQALADAPPHSATAYPPCPEAGPCNNPAYPSLADVAKEYKGPHAVPGDVKAVYHAIGRARMARFLAPAEPYYGPYLGAYRAVAHAALRYADINGAFGTGPFAAWSGGPLPLLKASIHGSPTVASGCSTYSVDGGCAASLGGTFVASTYFSTTDFATHARQSGQSWAGGDHPWGWNACGVESWFPCGHYTATASLLDPSTATLPTYCSYGNYTNNGQTVPGIPCSNSGNGISYTINGYNFALHSCLPLYIYYSTGTVTVTDNNFQTSSECVLVQTLVKVADNNDPLNVIWGYNTVNGDMYHYTLGQDCVVVQNTGTFTSYHNAYLQCSGRPVAFSPYFGANSATSTSDYVEDFSNDGTHGEFLVSTMTGTEPLEEYQYDTFVLSANSLSNCCTSMLFAGAGNGGQTVTHIIIDSDVMVDNLAGGSGGTETNSTQVEFPSNTVVNSQITNVYSDGTGLGTPGRHWATYATCTNPTTFSGNVNLVSGAAINSWSSVGGGSSGC
jgi:hypothetical protein